MGTALQKAMTLMGWTDAEQVVANLIQLHQELTPSPWMVTVKLPPLYPGQFPAISFTGPVQWYRQGDRGGHAAGTLTVTLDGSGVVTGTWEGEFEWEQGKYTFSGEFRGTLTPPGALGQVGDQQTHGWSLSGMEGNYSIDEYDRTGASKQVWNGRLAVENSEMVVVMDPDVAVSTESYASLHLRLTEGDLVGDSFGWKSESAAP